MKEQLKKVHNALKALDAEMNRSDDDNKITTPPECRETMIRMRIYKILKPFPKVNSSVVVDVLQANGWIIPPLFVNDVILKTAKDGKV